MSDDTEKPDDIGADVRDAMAEAGPSTESASTGSFDKLDLESWGTEVGAKALEAFPHLNAALRSGEFKHVLVRLLARDAYYHTRAEKLHGDMLGDMHVLDQEVREQEAHGLIAKHEPPKPASPAERKQAHSESMQKLDKLGDLMARAEFLVAERARQKETAH